MITITHNTDTVDIDQKCLGLNASRTTFPPDVREYIHTNRGLHIQIRHNGDQQTFAQANDIARLIAAAPEMFETLKRVQARLCEHCPAYMDDLGQIGDHTDECLEAIDLIAKAEGQS